MSGTSIIAQIFVPLTETYVVGTQKNHLNKTVGFSTHNTCLNQWVRK